MAKDRKGHGSEAKGGSKKSEPRRFTAYGHIIDHAVTPKTGQKMFVVGSSGNAYKNRSDAEAYAKAYPHPNFKKAKKK